MDDTSIFSPKGYENAIFKVVCLKCAAFIDRLYLKDFQIFTASFALFVISFQF